MAQHAAGQEKREATIQQPHLPGSSHSVIAQRRAVLHDELSLFFVLMPMVRKLELRIPRAENPFIK